MTLLLSEAALFIFMELINADCLEAMKTIEDGSVDMILCDLPYGITANKWDSIIPMDKLWPQLKRVCQNGRVVLFSSQPFTTKLISSNESEFKHCWYWIKNQATNFFHAKKMPLRKVEEICVFMDGPYNPVISTGNTPTKSAKGCSVGSTYHGVNKRNYQGGSTERYPTNVLDFKCVSNYSRLHSSEKPVSLLEYLIKTYSNEGDLVLDCCMGSGSTGEACQNTNREFIGIEKYEDIFEIAKKRLYV